MKPMTQDEILSGIIRFGHQWTDAEKWVLKVQCDRSGDFEMALWNCFALADEANFAQLSLGFPDQAVAFLAWRHGDLADRFRDAGIEI